MPAKELLAEFCKLEKEAEKMLEGPRVHQSMNPDAPRASRRLWPRSPFQSVVDRTSDMDL